EIRVLSFNVARNYLHVDALLESLKEDFNIIFIQEPPWRTVRHAPSTMTRRGDAVIRAPHHPDWISMVRWSGED
ncbi:hypothetical protein FA15DRAFT_569263, partial [Coprinopsis marcescibilis]